MISKRHKISVIIVALIIILSGFVLVLTNQKQEPSLAEKIAINSSDIDGNEWRNGHEIAPPFQFTSNLSSYQYLSCFIDGMEIFLVLAVYNTSQSCMAVFNLHQSHPMQNLSLGQLGFVINDTFQSHFIFLRDKVFVLLDVTKPSWAEGNLTTVYNVGLRAAEIQDSKIRTYYSDH
jgi:hypothetical protein